MKRDLPRTIRASLVAALALGWACGGDANKEGAATTDSAGATASAAAGDVNPSSANVSPAEAVAFMAAANRAEVEAAQIATRKATNAEVRRFAQQMQREHSKAARDDEALAKKLNVDLKATGTQGPMVTSLDSMAKQTTQTLNSTPKGAAFDRAYMDAQVQAHQTVLENLQRIAGSTGTAPAPAGGSATAQAPASAQEAAQKEIPHVQQHLDKAKEIQSKLGTAR